MKISINLINNLGQSFSSAFGKCLRQCGSRIFSDNRMTLEKIQAGHLEETLKRIKKEGDTPTSLFRNISNPSKQTSRNIQRKPKRDNRPSCKL